MIDLAGLQSQLDELRGFIAAHGARHELSGADQVRLSVLNGTTQLNRQRSIAVGTGLTATEVQGTNSYINIVAASGFIGAPFVTVGNDGTLTAERALTGTANQVTVTDNGANSSVVLSLPQNIHTGASPTFAGATLTGFTDITGGGLILTNATGSQASTADQARLGSYDIAAGRATLALGTEEPVNADVLAASTHSLWVRINGTNYKILLSNV